MSKKKKRRAEKSSDEEALEPAEDSPIGSALLVKAGRTGEDLGRQKLLATVGFGVLGFLAAFLTGANHTPAAPADLTAGLGLASWEGAVLGTHALNIAQGFATGLGGLLLGTSLGNSVFLAPGPFLMSWAAGGLLAALAYHFTGSFLLTALGWMLGCLPFILAPRHRQDG